MTTAPSDVLRLRDIGVGSQVAVAFAGEPLLVCRTEAGVFVVRNRCPHAGMSLYGGRITQGVLQCPAHGARFDLATGAPLTAHTPPLKTYSACLQAGMIVVEVDSAAASQPAGTI